MKIVFLNIWDARVEGVKDFLSQAEAEVFCLQEVFDNAISVARDVLKNYNLFTGKKYVRKHFNFASATLIRNDIKVNQCENLFNQGETGFGIYTQFNFNTKNYHLLNFHGMPQPGDKIDNPDRIKQSEEIIKYFSKLEGKKIIGGDFNLLPNTKSIKLFEENNYVNLIEKHKIDTTRNKYAWDRFPENKQLFSDYVFLSPDVKVENFTVPKNEISDHLPMIVQLG